MKCDMYAHRLVLLMAAVWELCGIYCVQTAEHCSSIKPLSAAGKGSDISSSLMCGGERAPAYLLYRKQYDHCAVIKHQS